MLMLVLVQVFHSGLDHKKMAVLTKASFDSKWTAKFADNATRDITEEFMREFKQDISDSTLFIRDIYFPGVAIATGTNSYVSTLSFGSSLPGYGSTTGAMVIFVLFQNGSTGASTINVSGLGVRKIYIDESTQVDNGDIVAGRIYCLAYDGNLDGDVGGFQIIGSGASGGGGGGVDSTAPSTAGGTITLDFQTSTDRIFVGDSSFATAKVIALDNEAGALRLSFAFEISNVAAELEFPASFKMNDVRWNSGTTTWTTDAIGKYKANAIFNGGDWLMEIFGPYS